MTGKTALPRGTRDFSPEEMARRNLIFDTITAVFRQHGFMPIETPAMENLTTLLGKYGEEGDKLIFKILNSGDFLSEVQTEHLSGRDTAKLALLMCGKGLRYDLTVPFARFVVMHQHELTFPFKRYQIQPVWRADKPQKGRYREFYQCDVDVIGSHSLLNEAELIRIIDRVFSRLGIGIIIRINHRKILTGLAETAGLADRFQDMTTALDKIDKAGVENALKELAEKGIPQPAIDQMRPILWLKGNNHEKLHSLKESFTQSPSGLLGISEMEEVLEYAVPIVQHAEIQIDPALARGLDYYTGTIIEVVAKDRRFGSLCGGGRYDDLTGIFGLEGMSGVGVAFGAERIYDLMLEMSLFPESIFCGTRILFVNFGKKEASRCLQLADQLRDSGISTEIYPEIAKLGKQFAYADKKGIPYVVLIGENELATGMVSIKDMKSGEQHSTTFEAFLNDLLA
ncbi:MAG: histidine--tRNA ligase [Bacteroidales bacterium]|nr:histidine--tRNA ligase [Lentimicrobiaceae bacterium]MDD5695765.1 histidine--tRNA ligase [Bacteroidales bacterium]